MRKLPLILSIVIAVFLLTITLDTGWGQQFLSDTGEASASGSG
jgi:hypothetical protein